MNRQNKILVSIGIVVFVFALIVIFWPTKKNVLPDREIKTIPASVVIIPTQDKRQLESTTGAMKTIMPEDEYKESMLSYTLRQLCPLKNDYFEISYDYGIDKFIVNIARENMETFLQWKKDTGYNFITDQYWQIKTND